MNRIGRYMVKDGEYILRRFDGVGDANRGEEYKQRSNNTPQMVFEVYGSGLAIVLIQLSRDSTTIYIVWF